MESGSGSSGSVVAVAGRRIDPASATVARFPSASIPALGKVFREFFIREPPALVVASAACGTDLVALDAAVDLAVPIRIVLPFEPARFKAGSVTDRLDPRHWGALFDRLLGALPSSDLIVLDEGAEPYSAVNAAIVDAAADRSAVRRIAVVAWEGEPRGDEDFTWQFARLAAARQFTVLEISTLDPRYPRPLAVD